VEGTVQIGIRIAYIPGRPGRQPRSIVRGPDHGPRLAMKAGNDRARRQGSLAVVGPSRDGTDAIVAAGRIGRDNAAPDDACGAIPQTQLASSLERARTTVEVAQRCVRTTI
jgi:hypothetical protein